ncbi:MAG: outer membrane protein transport protein, partial [Bacteroidales bacterium]|nr:outer membrane protein transport protein [Bacteroidales bacterium]
AAQGLNHSRLMTERGQTGEFNLSFGANFNHNFYLGGSLGINTLNYEKRLTHFEEVNGGWQNLTDAYIYFRAFDDLDAREDFTFTESINTSGIGVNLKVGAIYKPTNSLRIGAAIHTPSFYSFDEEYSTSVESNYIDLGFDEGNDQALIYETGGTNYEKVLGEFSYNFRTPLKGIGSVAYTFGTFGLISMDYEYTDYSTMQYKSKNSSINEMQSVNNQNDLIKNTFRATHNFRFGAEFKPTEVLTLRAGYGLNQSPYKEGHFKNDDKHQTYSAGIGYRMNNMFIDFGYMLRQEKYGYSLYYAAPYMTDGVLETAQITSNQHQLALTLGWRF